ncbi:hypothetical protein PQO03_04295 [Lentisphaera profundi]|uniref:Uncharacterized protein n=1 Tax=Lentisphaera profundi TaxID=1658616 RepID=A0ABY7VTT4_9BACT|nr:hypothetical protein [Lentisphaera profundi]WDE97174.1 hypothetical protein PQO03_04295 [Lentisphaera profundi]
MKKILSLVLLLCSSCIFAESKDSKDSWAYLDNGTVRIGIDRSRGGCIGFFGQSKTQRNLLNHFDEGRFVQQSYYGDKDGSNWNGNPWIYNPVQGGSWDKQPSRMLDFKVNQKDHSLYSKVEPRRWSSAKPCPEAIMEQQIKLKDNIASITFTMNYSGEDHNDERHQEMPAVFVDGALKKFYYSKEGKLVNEAPLILAEGAKAGKKGLGLGKSTSEWVAYVDDNQWGVGIYTPGTTDFTVYKALGDGTTGPDGSACSYVAPLRTFTLKKGLKVEYTVYMTIGSLKQIKSRFEALKAKQSLQEKK